MSLNQLVVAALSQAVAREEEAACGESPLEEQLQHIRTALGDVVVELNTSQFPPQLRPREDLPDRAAYMQSLPKLSPSLSAMIIADREDRL